MAETPLTQRPYLVFVRAGLQSLHPRLLAEDSRRNWDCCVSWYCEPRAERLAEFYASGGDNKFEGFEHFAAAQAAVLARYHYVLLLDDDVYFKPGDVSRFLALCDRHSMWLTQPSLRWSTHYNHALTLRNPACILRRVSFIEVMAPCFSAAALLALRGSFLLSKSSWGLDWAWAAMAGRDSPIHVVDAVCVEHTKPFDAHNGAFYRKLRGMGVDPAGEEQRILASFPDFVPRKRSLPQGHVYAHGLPATLGYPLLVIFDRLKFPARMLKLLRRQLHRWRLPH